MERIKPQIDLANEGVYGHSALSITDSPRWKKWIRKWLTGVFSVSAVAIVVGCGPANKNLVDPNKGKTITQVQTFNSSKYSNSTSIPAYNAKTPQAGTGTPMGGMGGLNGNQQFGNSGSPGLTSNNSALLPSNQLRANQANLMMNNGMINNSPGGSAGNFMNSGVTTPSAPLQSPASFGGPSRTQGSYNNTTTTNPNISTSNYQGNPLNNTSFAPNSLPNPTGVGSPLNNANSLTSANLNGMNSMGSPLPGTIGSGNPLYANSNPGLQNRNLPSNLAGTPMNLAPNNTTNLGVNGLQPMLGTGTANKVPGGLPTSILNPGTNNNAITQTGFQPQGNAIGTNSGNGLTGNMSNNPMSNNPMGNSSWNQSNSNIGTPSNQSSSFPNSALTSPLQGIPQAKNSMSPLAVSNNPSTNSGSSLPSGNRQNNPSNNGLPPMNSAGASTSNLYGNSGNGSLPPLNSNVPSAGSVLGEFPLRKSPGNVPPPVTTSESIPETPLNQ